MTREEKLNITTNRYNTLKDSPKNIKCPGVLRKLRRKIRSLSNEE